MDDSNKKEIEGIDRSTYAGKAAWAVKTKARGYFGDDLLTFKLIDFVSLMMLNNKFLSKGIAITDDNKEECYIKIIELNDESLIADLEKYITLKDEIKILEDKKEQYFDIINKLKRLPNQNDEDAVNLIVESYLRK
jgi:hypothetical protein